MGIWSRLAKTFRGGHHSEDIQEELQFHLDMDAADGHDYRQTRLRLGNMTRITEETRAVGIIEWLDSAGRDARYGVRQLRRTPALRWRSCSRWRSVSAPTPRFSASSMQQSSSRCR